MIAFMFWDGGTPQFLGNRVPMLQTLIDLAPRCLFVPIVIINRDSQEGSVLASGGHSCELLAGWEPLNLEAAGQKCGCLGDLTMAKV